MNTITPVELNQCHHRGETIHLIDVRTPAEFRDAHVPFARNVPLDALDPCAVVRSCRATGDTPIYVICQAGIRSAKACAQFRAAGFANAVDVTGGTNAWQQAGLEVVQGKKAISLERQIRIAAGILVLIGATLGYFVHPYFIGLAAFIGAGLTFAGITDTCGMGLLLARMPWNQLSSSGHADQTCQRS